MNRYVKWLATASVLSVTGAGCSASDEGLDSEKVPDTESSAIGEAYLPYGVSVPEGQTIFARPEPYSPSKHGAPLANSLAAANRADARDIPRDLELRHRGRPGAPYPPPGDGDRGFWVNAGTGIYAGNDVQDNLSIPNSSVGATIYAPTHQSGGGSCIETVTAHYRYSGMATTAHGHGFWDWCRASPGWGVFEAMDATWKGKYARVNGGENVYFTQVYKTGGNCWAGLLYNYTSGAWETKLTSCGTTKTGFGNTGWSMWESWSLVGCPSLPRVRAQSVQILNGAWQALAPATTSQLGPSAGSCFASSAYTFKVWTANSFWEGFTP
ncbi:hypothetical protein LZC95_00645 [Pendulispora brunnea]|uniref:Uncharacterized protein n=1 Tax=Pendulispora brunnea TaxID=2905690 RepID=A0ABZ2KDE2_9BACT